MLIKIQLLLKNIKYKVTSLSLVILPAAEASTDACVCLAIQTFFMYLRGYTPSSPSCACTRVVSEQK